MSKPKYEQKTLLDTKTRVCISITEYAKMMLTERGNTLGMSLSGYLEYMSRQPNTERR